MKLFDKMYDKIMEWSKHRFAEFWLSFVSFIEAIFFPLPPDIMLIPMSMAKPQNAFRYALYATIASVLGGIVGYSIGLYAFDLISGTINSWGMQDNFDKVKFWFETWGIPVLFLAGFSPIPYKIFTICAGVMQMAFFPFAIISAISRFARYLLIAKLSAWGGKKYEVKIRHSIELIGWGTIVLAIVAYVIYTLMK